MANINVYGALLLSGLLSSLGHCLGMCGPLVMILGLRLGGNGWRGQWPRHVVYHASRIMVYGILGALIGAIGSALGLGDQLTTVGSVISLGLGLLVILFGLGYLGWSPLGRLEGAGAWVSRAMGTALELGGWRGVIILGALNGLLPCCLVYAALLTAASTGGAASGAVAMVSFGLGTIPALLLVGLGAALLSQQVRQILTRVAGALMVLVGVQLALRGASALNLIPHLQWGRLVLW